MEQIRIRHCRLHLRRSGGWSWGPDPKGLVRLATRALPELLARELRHLLAGQDADTAITRLSIKVPVKMHELTDLALASVQEKGRLLLSARISRHLRQALAAQSGIDCSETDAAPDTAQDVSFDRNLPPWESKTDIVGLLADWYRQGRLMRLLTYFGDAAIGSWEKLALQSVPEAGDGPEEEQQDLMTKARSLLSKIRQSIEDPENGGICRLVMLAALLRHFPGQFSSGALTALLHEQMPAYPQGRDTAGSNRASAVEESEPVVPVHADLVKQRPTADRKHTGFSETYPVRPAVFQLKVGSVLPFIAMGVLSRLGYFNILSTALSAEDIEPDSGYFAAALAFKMLSSPHRGWYRNTSDQLTAAAAGGFNRPVTGEELDRFAVYCAPGLSPIDGYLRLLLVEGHDPAHALYIHKFKTLDKPMWLLMDSQGCFPIGWFFTPAALVKAVNAFDGNTFLISESAAETSLFSELTRRRYRFVTSLPPGREEIWHPIDRQRRWWTNDPDAQTAWLRHQSRHLPALTQSAEQVSQALIADRCVLSKSGERYAMQFERSLALAAGSALATIAWQLWGGDGATDPMMTLDRFGDWEGDVSFDEEKITVRPALGQRYLDARHHNLLIDVAGIPWFHSRRMEFAGL